MRARRTPQDRLRAAIAAEAGRLQAVQQRLLRLHTLAQVAEAGHTAIAIEETIGRVADATRRLDQAYHGVPGD